MMEIDTVNQKKFKKEFNLSLAKSECKLHFHTTDISDPPFTYDDLKEIFTPDDFTKSGFLSNKIGKQIGDLLTMCIKNAYANALLVIGIVFNSSELTLIEGYLDGKNIKSEIEGIINSKLLQKNNEPIFEISNGIKSNDNTTITPSESMTLVVPSSKQSTVTRGVVDPLTTQLSRFNSSALPKTRDFRKFILEKWKNYLQKQKPLITKEIFDRIIELSIPLIQPAITTGDPNQLITVIKKEHQSINEANLKEFIKFLHACFQEAIIDTPTVSLFWKKLAKLTIKQDFGEFNKYAIKDWFINQINQIIDKKSGGSTPVTGTVSVNPRVKLETFGRSFIDNIMNILRDIHVDEETIEEIQTNIHEIMKNIFGGSAINEESISTFFDSIKSIIEDVIKKSTKTKHIPSLLQNILGIFLKALLEKGVYSIEIDLNICQIPEETNSYTRVDSQSDVGSPAFNIIINNLSISFKKIVETTDITPQITSNVSKKPDKLDPIVIESASADLSNKIFNEIIQRKKTLLGKITNLDEYIHSYYDTKDDIDFDEIKAKLKILKQLNFNFILVMSIDTASGVEDEEIELPLKVKEVTLVLHKLSETPGGGIEVKNPTNPKNIMIGDEHVQFSLYRSVEENNDVKKQFMEKLNQALEGPEFPFSGGRRFRRNRRSVKRRGSKKTLKKRSGKYGGKRSGKSHKKAKKYTYGKKC